MNQLPLNPRNGLIASVLCSFSFATMAALIFEAHRIDPNLSVLVTTFLRISVNLIFVVLVMKLNGLTLRLPREHLKALFGRAIFGTTGLIFSFEAIKLIGTGEASFLQSTSSVFITLMSPWFLGERNSKLIWAAVIGSLIGTYLLLQPNLTDDQPWGRITGLSAAVCTAFAMILISKVRGISPSYAIFSFTLLATLVIGVLLLFFPVQWPTDRYVWILLFAAGFAGTLGQYFLTYSFENAPASLVAATNYLNPVLSMVIGVVIFQIHPTTVAWCGVAFILFFGLIIPFSKT